MAARLGKAAATADSVTERRIKPILECLDQGLVTEALKQANQLLKKNEGMLSAKILKGLALSRLERAAEAHAIIKEVVAEQPTTLGEISLLTALCQDADAMDDLTTAIEAAVARDPNNEEYHEHLFISYAKRGERKRQQQEAMALYKLSKHTVHHLWAIVSMYLQADEAPEGDASSRMLLTLAERLLEKAGQEHKLDTLEALQLYFMVLEKQQKYADCLKLLDDDAACRFQAGKPLVTLRSDIYRLKLKFLQPMRQWQDINALATAMIKADPDNWDAYQAYFDSVEHIIASNDAPCGERRVPGDYSKSLDDVRAFIASTQAMKQTDRLGAEQNAQLRGPYLARLEVVKRLAKSDPSGSLEKEAVPHLLDYFGRFGTKGCCFYDMKPYMALVPPSQRLQLVKEMREVVANSGADAKKTLQQYVCVEQLRRSLGVHDDPSSNLPEIADEIIVRYRESLPLGKDLKHSEIQYADPYAILAAHVLVDLFVRTGVRSHLFKAIVLLERASESSAHNMQLRILLVKLYSAIGAVGPALDAWQKLDVKQIQHDSLSYIFADFEMTLGSYESAEEQLHSAKRFFASARRDMPGYLSDAYKYGSFGKVKEFTLFQNKLQRSLQNAWVNTQQLFLRVLHQVKHVKDCKELLDLRSVPTPAMLDNLSDHRDFFVMDCFDHHSRDLSAVHKAYLTSTRVQWLRFRTTSLRALHAVLHSHKAEEFAALRKELAETHAEGVKALLESDAAVPDFPFIFGIAYPRGSMFALYHKFGYLRALDLTLELVSAAAAVAESKPKGSDLQTASAALREQAGRVVGVLKESLQLILAQPLSDTGALTTTILESIHFWIETAAFVSLGLRAVIPSEPAPESKPARQLHAALTGVGHGAYEELAALSAQLRAKLSEPIPAVQLDGSALNLENVEATAERVAARLHKGYATSYESFCVVLTSLEAGLSKA
eukprot:m.137789 g.137789  ORF g.137789 m.137789 type:complete len:946 (+) comp16611_c0_seq1:55-2892(+)